MSPECQCSAAFHDSAIWRRMRSRLIVADELGKSSPSSWEQILVEREALPQFIW